MRELSVQAANAYVRSRAAAFGIKPNIFEKRDIHVHVPEGATPKDGPSAGVAMTTSIVSVLTLASRVTGLVRETLVASMFGATAMTDAFNVAFRIPNMFRRFFAEGAFSQAAVWSWGWAAG